MTDSHTPRIPTPGPTAPHEAELRARIIASPVFARSAADWTQGVAALDPPLEPVAPASDLWDRIQAATSETPPATLTVRADGGDWEDLYPGVTRRVMHADRAQGWQAMLIRMEPGSRHPGHGHSMIEECLVLEGEFVVGDLTVRKGDLHLAFPTADHPEIHSPTGALLYIRTALAA
jgi:anti-sigma factor ChrR (cupin superfamily)